MLRLALPSKGELEEPTLSFLASCGLEVERPNDRQYTASIPALPGVVVLFQRAADIAAKVEEGSADLGITGYDTVCETAREGGDLLVLWPDLGFSRCELVLAVPDAWVDVSSLADLAELAVEFRERGRELRIATKYPRLVGQFLFDKGIPYFALVSSSGAMEAAPVMGYADLIADLTSSGTTLRENRLKVIEGGAILTSQACLVGNRRSLKTVPSPLEQARVILELIEGRLRASDYYRITANVRGGTSEGVAEAVLKLPEAAGLQGPTVSPVYSKGKDDLWHAVTVVVAARHLLPVVGHLRAIGGSGITVTSVQYVFEAASRAYERLCKQLGR